ncbi:TonB-dependent receptor [Bergeyella sp. RCAD1439]|uniref:TonB-dependent receptor n=1 Tax=Bergeyella anatis TaxID=3113737 RepID=UPI002E194923|nr:TonB-dependent receptor plug domain-containing protein [Bergeyella sp. RCAD1439]
MKGFFILGLCVSPAVWYAQEQAQDSVKVETIETVSFVKRLPVTKEIINVERDLRVKNLAQDLPILLKNQMSVVSTSDAGNGVGYTGWRIRGTGGAGINVMLNGVPYNDSESFGTFFVNVSDLASSASNIVIQRGVGSSTNGVGTFGASVNVLTRDPEDKAYALTNQSYGSFNTRRHAFELGSGKLFNNKLSLMGRYSMTQSDGYIDRAFSDLKSYNFTALFEEGRMRLRFMAFGGKEKTYQAWNGITWEDFLKNPKTNYSGAIYGVDGSVTGYYDNETDNYRQNHYHLLWEQAFSENWNLATTVHYTRGKGYYENYRQNDRLNRYQLEAFEFGGATVSRADLIRYKWLDNHFYGVISNLYGKTGDLELNFGLATNQYLGDHFGEVTSVRDYGVNIPNKHRYYLNRSLKNEMAWYGKALYRLGRFDMFADVQFRGIGYHTEIKNNPSEGADIDRNWLFFNPKAGVNFRLPQGKVYLSYAHAHREPNRGDLIANLKTEAEKLHDVELGVEKQVGRWLTFSTNGYLMYYENQLVLTGKINDVGAMIRENSGESYRLGLETAVSAKVARNLTLSGNMTLSQNRNKNYKTEDSYTDASGATVLVAKNHGDTAISYSPNFISSVSVAYRPLEKLDVTLTNQYVGRQYLDNTQNDQLKLPGYNVLDALVGYRMEFNRYDLGINLMVNNILNRKYANNGYVYDGVIVYPQAGTNYMLGMTLKFR